MEPQSLDLYWRSFPHAGNPIFSDPADPTRTIQTNNDSERGTWLGTADIAAEQQRFRISAEHRGAGSMFVLWYSADDLISTQKLTGDVHAEWFPLTFEVDKPENAESVRLDLRLWNHPGAAEWRDVQIVEVEKPNTITDSEAIWYPSPEPFDLLELSPMIIKPREWIMPDNVIWAQHPGAIGIYVVPEQFPIVIHIPVPFQAAALQGAIRPLHGPSVTQVEHNTRGQQIIEVTGRTIGQSWYMWTWYAHEAPDLVLTITPGSADAMVEFSPITAYAKAPILHSTSVVPTDQEKP
jgi:hypothetical protein